MKKQFISFLSKISRQRIVGGSVKETASNLDFSSSPLGANPPTF